MLGNVLGMIGSPVTLRMVCVLVAWRWLVAVVCLVVVIASTVVMTRSWTRRMELRAEGRSEESERYWCRTGAALITTLCGTIVLGLTAVIPVPDPILVIMFLLSSTGVDILTIRTGMRAIRARCDDAYEAGYEDGARAATGTQEPAPAPADKPSAAPTDVFND